MIYVCFVLGFFCVGVGVFFVIVVGCFVVF